MKMEGGSGAFLFLASDLACLVLRNNIDSCAQISIPMQYDSLGVIVLHFPSNIHCRYKQLQVARVLDNVVSFWAESTWSWRKWSRIGHFNKTNV